MITWTRPGRWNWLTWRISVRSAEGRLIRKDGKSDVEEISVLDEEGKVVKSIYTKNPVYKESWEHQFGLPVEEHERRYTINRFDDFVTISVQDRGPGSTPRPILKREE